HAVVLRREAVLGDQILMDSLRREPLPELGENDLAKRLACAGRAEDRHGIDRCRRTVRPGGGVWPVLRFADLFRDVTSAPFESPSAPADGDRRTRRYDREIGKDVSKSEHP